VRCPSRWAGGEWKRRGEAEMSLGGRWVVVGVTQKAREPVAWIYF